MLQEFIEFKELPYFAEQANISCKLAISSLQMVTKKSRNFFLDQSQSRAKIQTMARKNTHSDKVQNMAFLVNNVPFAKFSWDINRAQGARFARYSDKSFFARQSRSLATRSDLKI